jgi:hypothetical protein
MREVPCLDVCRGPAEKLKKQVILAVEPLTPVIQRHVFRLKLVICYVFVIL